MVSSACAVSFTPPRCVLISTNALIIDKPPLCHSAPPLAPPQLRRGQGKKSYRLEIVVPPPIDGEGLGERPRLPLCLRLCLRQLFRAVTQLTAKHLACVVFGQIVDKHDLARTLEDGDLAAAEVY